MFLLVIITSIFICGLNIFIGIKGNIICKLLIPILATITCILFNFGYLNKYLLIINIFLWTSTIFIFILKPKKT